jgi:hypothetical protein
MRKRKFYSLFLTVTIAMPLITGCGAISKANEIISTKNDIMRIVDEVVALSEQIDAVTESLSVQNDTTQSDTIKSDTTQSDIIENGTTENYAAQSDIEENDVDENAYYTSSEFIEKFTDELELLYQNDLNNGLEVTPTRMADTPDGLEYLYFDLTIPLDKKSCDPSDDSEGFIVFLANDFYYTFEDFFFEKLEDEQGYVKYDVYAIYREHN